MQNVNAVVWTPSPEHSQATYAHRLMQKLGATDRDDLWKKSIGDISKFWDVVVRDLGIVWDQPYRQVVDISGGLAWSKWFVGGKLNIARNCVDRHAGSEKPAIVWEGDGGEVRNLSYAEFADTVGRAANALRALNVQAGDRIAILMPMVPETVIQLFACFKIGAVAIPIFSGFGWEAISQRLQSAEVKVVFTSDCAFRRGKRVDVKSVVDKAVDAAPSVHHVIVFRRGTGLCDWQPRRDKWWDEFVLPQSPRCESVSLDAESPSMILFTSGTTGKPKGAIHTHAGALATIGKELRYSFNVDDQSRFFWFTDIGWMMGPWEMIGVTLFGGTLMLFEGAPDYPDAARLWQFIDKNKITHLGISPTAIRLLMKYGEEIPSKHPMPSLQYLGSTGEPWDPQSYQWFFNKVGKKRIPIINISGGTEIVGCLLIPLPLDSLKPCSLGRPGLGVDADVFDEAGKSVRGGIGHLVIKQPLPSMTKSFLNDEARYLSTYFSKFPGVWYHGDWAHVDDDGHWFLHGRSDDTIKVAGKRIGPAEYEAALMSNTSVAEVAAVGIPDELKGEVAVCFVVVKPGIATDNGLHEQLVARVNDSLGKAMAPKAIHFVSALPKTRSAKILRSMIRRVYLGEPAGDISSVENPEALEALTLLHG